jgi:hypothetical protein
MGFAALYPSYSRYARIFPPFAMNAFPSGMHEVDADAERHEMSNPDWAVRIVAVPPGEAPLWVRQKWVGLDLPVVRYAAHRKFLAFGVLSIPQSWPAQWAAILRGRAERVAGYAVEAALAVGILAKVNPDAAAWWRENTPHLIAPKRYLVFHEEVCRIADI